MSASIRDLNHQVLGWLLLLATSLALLGDVEAAPPPGVVIDHVAASTRTYVGSPSIVILPSGEYLASHDFFGPSSTEARSGKTVLFRSADRGATWTEIVELADQYWSSFFIHRGELYLMGTNREYGDVVIRKSSDGGYSWTTPSSPTTGLLTSGGQYATAPVPIVEKDGRIYRAMERNGTPFTWGTFQALMMSASSSADLLDAASWSLSNRLNFPAGSGGTAWLEGNAVIAPDGGIANILRVQNVERAAITHLDPATNTLSMNPASDFIDLPGGSKKFTIRHDAASGRYYTLANPALPRFASSSTSPAVMRNALAIMSSPDLRQWTVHDIVLYHSDPAKHAFQYLDWQFGESDDIVAVSRTAFDDDVGGANSAHNANYLTFHRFTNFRDVTDNKRVLLTDIRNGRVLRYQVVDNEWWVSDGVFAQGKYGGAPLTMPLGLALDGSGRVYVGEQTPGGRILQFDRGGRFLGVIATEGAGGQFTGNPEALTVGPDGALYLSVAFGTGADRIYRIDLATRRVSLFIDTTGSGYTLNNPRGITFGPDGSLYVADRDPALGGSSGVDAVRKFSGASGTLIANVATPDRPQGLSYDRTRDRLLITVFGNPDIFEYPLRTFIGKKIYDNGTSGNFLDVKQIGDGTYFTRYEQGDVLRVSSLTTADPVVVSLNGPGHLMLLP